MSIFHAFILGIIQGITEFLPVSSSGHLVVVQSMFNIKEPQIIFDVIVHLGTLLAVILFFLKDLIRIVQDSLDVVFRRKLTFQERMAEKNSFPYARVGIHLMISMVPTILIALAFHDQFEKLLGNPKAVGIAWIVMGCILVLSRHFQDRQKNLHEMRPLDALVIGIAQGIAIIPGISRSGSTILAGMLMGIGKQGSAVFSFLLSIPTIIAAATYELRHGLQTYANPEALWVGFVTSAVVGYAVIHLLMQMVKQGQFYVFGYYCLAIGIFTTFVTLNGGF